MRAFGSVNQEVEVISDKFKKLIFDECMRPGGFAFSIRENRVDEAAFKRLIEAVNAIAAEIVTDDSIDRVTIGCLFELPWEIENTVDHYSSRSPELGKVVSRMADSLRESINDLLWRGLKKHYENLE